MSEKGRVKQKQKTRQALLKAALARNEAGLPITVAEVAKDAGLSTATAYRYFKDPEVLQLEATLAFKMAPEAVDFADLERRFEGKDDISERVLITRDAILNSLRMTDQTYRLFLAKQHQAIAANGSNSALHQYTPRRKLMLERALAPVKSRLRHKDWDNAILALASACGPEAFFMLLDQFELKYEEAAEVLGTNLRVLTKALVIDRLYD